MAVGHMIIQTKEMYVRKMFIRSVTQAARKNIRVLIIGDMALYQCFKAKFIIFTTDSVFKLRYYHYDVDNKIYLNVY